MLINTRCPKQNLFSETFSFSQTVFFATMYSSDEDTALQPYLYCNEEINVKEDGG
jgi:hypothetical protein